MLFVPPDFGQLEICCVINHSAVHRCQASHSSPPGSRCGMTLTLRRCARSPLHVVFRRDVTHVHLDVHASPRLPSAAASSLVSCLLAENAGSLLPSVILMMYTDKLCYTN